MEIEVSITKTNLFKIPDQTYRTFSIRSINNVALKLGIACLTDLYNVFEKHNGELAMTDDAHQNEFTSIQERFYAIACKIEDSKLEYIECRHVEYRDVIRKQCEREL